MPIHPSRQAFLVSLAALAVLLSAWPLTAQPIAIHVDPITGSDLHHHHHHHHPTVVRTLAQAQALARTLKRNSTTPVEIVLANSAPHDLSSAPLVLTAADSNTHIRSRDPHPHRPAALQAGVRITGWQPWKSSNTTTSIWRAPLPASVAATGTRQLWVNGRRAVRARSSGGFTGGSADPSWGFRGVPDTMSLGSFVNAGAGVELVFHPPGSSWTEPRCPVLKITPSTTTTTTTSNPNAPPVDIAMGQPCFSNGHLKGSQSITYPAYLENSLQLLDAPGEWYADLEGKQVYYAPLPGEDLPAATVMAGTLGNQSMVTVLAGAENITFTGVTFEFQTWMLPSTGVGYMPVQSGFHFRGPNTTLFHGIGGAVAVHGGRNVGFNNCTFQHLGLGGLATDHGAQNVSVSHCLFDDISAAAVSFGNVSHPILPPTQQDRALTLADSVVTNTPAEFHGCAGVFAGYTSNLQILHNRFVNTSCGSICIGWGWGAPNSMANNSVLGNHVVRSNSLLKDTGSIYTLSAQPGSEIAYNYLQDQVLLFGSLYHDAGSAYFNNHHNVIDGGPMWLYTQRPSLHAAYNISVSNIWTNQPHLDSEGLNITITNVHNVTGQQWPAEAQAIIAAAGPRKSNLM